MPEREEHLCRVIDQRASDRAAVTRAEYRPEGLGWIGVLNVHLCWEEPGDWVVKLKL